MFIINYLFFVVYIFIKSRQKELKYFLKIPFSLLYFMEHTGFEPVASTMRMLRAPNCANAPDFINKKMEAMGLEPMTSRV